ncbi:response regulator transcription factor [Actinomadura rupiterrae]|uniref:response regulator transcription factor n=1 Tax=Actinomadura rupiterrae TaxID=559627 RepID=UPI0020A5C890|nr:response regulator transcription factor [Actinomadura rupiterrae]MCP2343168.1 DNA-binding NarL/FixJ family response regulator [Actinomadura rupiterrae]
MTAKIKVVVADDQEIVRTGLRLLLQSTPDMHVVGEAATGEQAVAEVTRTRPDVVLMDVQMPDSDGITATQTITQTYGPDHTRVLILTTFNLDRYVFDALYAGASGFLLKDTPAADLLTAIRIVSSGEALLSPSITRKLIEEFTQRPQEAVGAAQRLSLITQREREVLHLVARGRTNDEIALELRLSRATVKSHVSNLLAKLDARDRIQLVIFAYESNMMR